MLPAINYKKRKELCQIDNTLIVCDLLKIGFDPVSKKLKPGAIDNVLDKWRPQGHLTLSRSTVQRIWKKYNTEYPIFESKLLGTVDMMTPKKKGVVGRKSKLTEETSIAINDVIRDGWKNKPYDITYREMEVMLRERNISISFQTIQKYCKIKGVKMNSCNIKPKLTDSNKTDRLRHVLNQIDYSNLQELKYLDQSRRVHIDEKWFFRKIKICSKIYTRR
jgi:hypothetical protein